MRFRDTQHLAGICQRIAAAVGRRVDESSPMVDARLKDGSRVNIVFPPLALDGPYVSIRKFGKKPIDLGKLVEFGALTPHRRPRAGNRRPLPPEHHHLGRHRVGQNDHDERPVALHRPG